MNRASIFFRLTLVCLAAVAGCKDRTAAPGSKETSGTTVDVSRNEGNELKPKADRTTAKDDKELGDEVVAAWKQASAHFAWYEPNKPSPGDWRPSDTKPSSPGVLPVFTMYKLEPGMIQQTSLNLPCRSL